MEIALEKLHGHRLALPQVVAALLFAKEPPPALLLVPEARLRRYRDLSAFGARVYLNPGLEALEEKALFVLSYEEALSPFPEDPEAWRLLLEVGRAYPREALLSRLLKLGYARDEDYRVLGEVVELGEVRLEFFGDELERLLVRGEERRRHILLPKPGKAEGFTSKKVLHFPGPVYLDTPALAPEALWPLLAGRPVVALGGGVELPPLELGARPLPPYRGSLKALEKDLACWLEAGKRVHLFVGHARTLDYLKRRLQAFSPLVLDRFPGPKGRLALLPGDFEGGAEWGEWVLLTEALVFATGGVRARVRVGEGLSDPGALSPGDYLIHPEHGIGQYLGLETREVLGVKRDYLVLRYKGEGKLYLPVEQLPLLKRHPGTTDDPPELSSLGKGEWQRAKEKARKDVEELAGRLLVLQAKRKATPGRAFPPLPEWDPLVEKGFPYELTPDQKRALEEVLRDLESPHPMDRLVSGDVGFGKTEVALRAAHRVVGHGAQVAFLVPTTLLAEQHGKTFRERFQGLPVRVAVLSRFTPPKEEEAILKGLAEGTVDIVIGTHRLLQEDVRFRDLGLLIVDEEHRFGVAQKERIRELKAEVDTLYLSATPIPRTLYSALVGLKDLSSIKTPPPGRKPIRTFLAPFDPLLVREAILFELERGGKVFYVHDRVASIEARRRFLEGLVPEARIGVVHGQMPEGLIEETMLLFAEGAYDVLLATTIIEAGLDVPEANTILIERADRLGLATLYQLRGRVGRREEEAYAYLFHPPRLTEAAEKRLAAIADLSDLGSGHLLAEKDMEIRGVGNLLGPEQHGHIRALSLEVYTELLEEAIRKLKGEVREERPHVTVDLALSARLPAEYVPSLEARSRYYSRFAEAKSLAELSRLVRELKARYGPLPEEAENFVALARLRLVAERKGVVSITEGLTHLEVVFPRYPLDYDARGLKGLPYRVELTQYPPGFRLEKKGLRPRDYPEALMEALYLFADR
ncbi:transcription-repair coupling factor (superfamily II helicase) [Thermus arciformis]|uniref:Transcription-repair-coupling factor n=1 Tax=Thermus arciformis TaxID=482827 RepID=A0A1G7F035_9DEIN|nr:transcription-repair coupling factor [Thermus arciformis]SDE69281.1 transcription-repair coupling factor (superfamily II helicase) [Thermus arciformis]